MIHPDAILEQSLIDRTCGAARAPRAVESGNGSWALVAPVRKGERALGSQREAVKTRRNLNTAYRYVRDRVGMNRIEVGGCNG